MRTHLGRSGLVLAAMLAALVVVAAMQGTDASNTASAPLEPYVPTLEELREAYQRSRAQGPRGRVYKERITPNWLEGNTRFWYRNDLRGGAREFILVDAERGTRGPAFDHSKLAQALSQAAGGAFTADHLPFDRIEFLDGGKTLGFSFHGAGWRCDLVSYACVKSKENAPEPEKQEEGPPPPTEEEPAPEAAETELQERKQPRGQPGEALDRPVSSPDGKWVAQVANHNVVLRSKETGQEHVLSQDGKEGRSYGMLAWAPDSRTLTAFRIEPGDRKEVYLIESSPKEGGRAKLHTRPYALPGDKYPVYELNLFNVADKKQHKPALDPVDFGRPRLRWHGGGRYFTFEKVDRGHQRFRLIEVDAHTAQTRNLIDEEAKTFIWTAHAENVGLQRVNWLDKTHEIIYATERDGWRHLYLIDAATGKVKNPITRGEYVVRGIDRIDEAGRQVWFRASGKNPGQDPYLVHYYRASFDGGEPIALTEGNGQHTVQFSPDRAYLIDSYSRVDAPPIHELRRTSDGKLVCRLEEADITELRTGGWAPPEVFVAKGRDGVTDIWGIICRPPRLDPNKKYPVIETIYAGPQGSFVPKTFSAFSRFSTLTELGFIVVQIDGMGTANRSKAFHDVCWKNLKDAGFPDRILWHQAAARVYPYYDISRVGIHGTSAGGQNAAAGVLFHPDFYKAAVASCGCHDNRMDKASWNEQWMGYPVGPQYSESSNIDNAHRLRGKLMLIVGEMDTNVPPESTLRLADSLIKAGKDFDLVFMPGVGHSNGGAYGERRRQDFFVRHLHGVAPPERNGERKSAAE